MAVGVSVSVSKVAVYSRMTEVNSFYARVVADGGTISDFSALRLAVLDYKAVQSLEPSLYTFASGRKAGTQYSLVPADGSGDLSVTRSGDTGMELDANGVWQPVAANLPRYDYVGGRPMINVEDLRTNFFLNSDILVTQNITSTNEPWTVSFYGTGTITFSGTYTGSLVGTGVNNRVSLTFTPTAGTLTCTVSGSVLFAQAEKGSFITSYIKTTGAAETRNADVIASAVDYSNIKTLVINNDAYVVETALPNNGYTLPQLDINKLAMFTNTLTDEQITAQGWTKKVLAFAVSVNIAAGTTISIEVNGVGTIEWGDGTSDSYSSLVTKTHVYTGGYKGLILFTGTLTRFGTASNANWYFNVKDLPANLTYFDIGGSNTITGNIADAPANLTVLYIAGSNTITGNIADAPANLTFLYITGSNTLTGNIADAPANLTTLYIAGSNTITGNIADAPVNLTTLYIAGLNTLADYTAGRVWKTNYNYLFLRQAAGAGLSSTEVDNLLIDLAATTWGGSSRTLDIGGVNAARTSASDAAVLSLQAQSVTVLTN